MTLDHVDVAGMLDYVLRDSAEPELCRVFALVVESDEPRGRLLDALGFADPDVLDCLGLPPERQVDAMVSVARAWPSRWRRDAAEALGVLEDAQDVVLDDLEEWMPRAAARGIARWRNAVEGVAL